MSLHGYDKKLPIISVSMEDVNTRRRILNFFFFCEITIDTVVKDLTSEKLGNLIAQYNEMEKLQRSVKQRELAFFLIKIVSYTQCILTAIRYSLNTYPMCNSPLKKSARRSFCFVTEIARKSPLTEALSRKAFVPAQKLLGKV